MPEESTNPEIRDLSTHAFGMVNQHKTIETKQPVQINPPVDGGHASIYDAREERFKTKIADNAGTEGNTQV